MGRKVELQPGSRWVNARVVVGGGGKRRGGGGGGERRGGAGSNSRMRSADGALQRLGTGR